MQPKKQTPPTTTQSQTVELSFNGVKYGVQDMLGSGVTSDVYKATILPHVSGKQPNASETIAVKHVKDSCREEFLNEISLQGPLNHPCILKIKGFQMPGLETDHKNQLLALEYCQHELFDIIKETGGFTEDIGRFFFVQQLLPAVAYIHGQGVCHRDIKLENIFVGQDFKLRLADFSYAARTFDPKTGTEAIHRKTVGTKYYVAPEIQRGIPYHGKPADVFSLGVSLFMMVMGQNPFTSLDFYKALWKGQTTDLFWAQFAKSQKAQVGKEFKDLIEKMLDYNPATRITIEQIAQHEWCQGLILDEGFIKSCFNANQTH